MKAATSAAFTSSFLTLTTKASVIGSRLRAVGDDGDLDVADLVAIEAGGLLAGGWSGGLAWHSRGQRGRSGSGRRTREQ